MNGVVFDFDGVLADSEPLSWHAWQETLAPHGVVIDDADVLACTGRTDSDTYLHFLERAALPSLSDVLQEVDRCLLDAFRTDLTGFGDAINTVQALAMVGVPLGVASSSSRVHLNLKMEILGLDRYFEVTVAGDEVDNGKPAPDLYSTAVELLRIDAASSVAVEDTAVGADAAAAAGLRIVIVNRMGLPTGLHPVVSEVDPDLLLLWLGRA
ncbi:MAG: HAD family phosphatase [bacterium]|nr:HAD family phosphatase [bacterium]MCP4968305.1 HAD family phosphatase [bacterium]